TINQGTLAVSFLPNAGSPSPIGRSLNGSNDLNIANATLRYVGSGGTTDRLFNLGGSSVIDSSGSGPISFTNTGTITGGGTVVLSGVNGGRNTFAPII